MANTYTYDDFVKQASGAGLLGSFSQHDLDLARVNPQFGLSILAAKQDYNNASTREAKLLANQRANELRNAYGGYSGGGDGLQYIHTGATGTGQSGTGQSRTGTAGGPTVHQSALAGLENQLGSYGAFSYDTPKPTRQTVYADALNAAADKLTQRREFSYDLEGDPSWSAYKKQYRREGDRAAANALAQASAATGGVPSSYAQTAAGQAGDYYAARLSDMVPTLYQQAYDRYLNEQQLLLSDLAALRGLAQDENQRYLDELGQWNNDRDVARTIHQDAFNQLLTKYNVYRGAEETAYQRQQDERETAWQRQQAEEQMKQQAQQQAWNNGMDLWNTLGYANAGAAQALGIAEGTPTAGQAQADWSMRRTDSQDRQSAQQQALNNAMERWTMLGYADQAVADALGVPLGTRTSDQSYREWSMKQQERASASGGGGSYGAGGGGTPNQRALFAAALASENPQNYISSHYKEYGFTSVSGLYDAYQKWKPAGSTYSAAQMGPENVAGMTDYVKKLYTAVDNGSGGRTREEVRSELEKLGWDEAQVDATVQSVGWEGAQTYLLLKKQGWDDELINLIFSRIGL